MHQEAMFVRVTGRVQGVGFRVWTQGEARALGLTGWVRNADDGSVETLLCGPVARLEEMLATLHRGPPAAIVRDVTAEPETPPATADFIITG